MFAKPFYNFLYSLFLVAITAAFSSYFNRAGMQSFYPSLNVSVLTPPNFVFPIVWGFLYLLLIIAFDMVLNSGKSESVRQAATMFTLSMFLHVLWTYVFFYNAYFLTGFAVLVVLDFVTAVMLYYFYQVNKTAAIMLIAYFLWLLFATYLNWAIVDLNGTVLQV